MSKQSTAGLIKYVKFLVDAGAMKRPLWLNALEKVPPPELTRAGRRPPTITFPEDELVRHYYRRNPAASLEPVDLSSFEPPPARRYAARHMELTAAGMPARQARDLAEAEVAAATAAAPGRVRTVVEIVQREEEERLKQALQMYTDRHGHVPPPAPAPAPGGPRQHGQPRKGYYHAAPAYQRQGGAPKAAQPAQTRKLENSDN